jgi:hypothetical protein
MKIVKTSLKEMLLTGQIGELKADLEREQVREIMGNPETWSVIGKHKREDNAAIWKYGLLEYSFGDSSYIDLEIHSHSKDDALPENIQIEGYFPNSATSLEEFEEFLEKNQLEAIRDKKLTYGSQATLNIGSNSVVFSDNLIHAIFLQSN